MKQKSNNHKKIIMVLVLLASILLLTPIVFAKYQSLDILNNKTEIAKPIFEVQGTESSKISAIQNKGYYDFTIKNFNDTGISEIGFLYTIEIIADVDESVQFELYKEDEKIELQDLKTKLLSIQANQEIEQNYKLIVTYDSSLGEKGKDILQEVQIKVHSEQMRTGS